MKKKNIYISNYNNSIICSFRASTPNVKRLQADMHLSISISIFSILFTITLSLYNIQKHEQIKYVNI
jgi:hypothetical protein